MVGGRLRTREAVGYLPELQVPCQLVLCPSPSPSPLSAHPPSLCPPFPGSSSCSVSLLYAVPPLLSDLSFLPHPLSLTHPPHFLFSVPYFLSWVTRHCLHLLTWQASSPGTPPAHTLLSVILPGYTAWQVAVETMEILRHWSRSGKGSGGGRWMLQLPPTAPHFSATSLLSRKLSPSL